MRLIDHNEVVVTPVESFEVDLAGFSTKSSQVGMIENVEVEPVSSKEVPAVIDRVKGPVLTEFLGTQNKDAIIAKLVVLNDRQGLERLAEANAVGDDASVVLFDLVDCAENTIPLKTV
jgi:hypothetical protein